MHPRGQIFHLIGELFIPQGQANLTAIMGGAELKKTHRRKARA
jgi:hypothetical protein